MLFSRINSGLIALLMGLFISCSAELDSVRPKDRIARELLTEADISKLRLGMYSQMEDVAFAYGFDFDVRGENLKAGPSFGLNDPVNMSPTSPDITRLWQTTYRVLSGINFVVETVDALGAKATPAALSIRGEALYFRGLLYYYLVTRWGGVPLLTSRTYEALPRASEEQVWNQIKADLAQAETVVSPFTDRFYVSVSAVQALQARVFLALDDKPNAIIYADKVLNAKKFDLAADANGYASMFIAGSTSKELIFAFANNTPTNRHLFYQQVNDVDPTWDYAPSDAMFTSLYTDTPLKAGDRRRSAVFSSDPTRIIKFPNGRTGQQLVATTNADQTPIFVSRLAEIMLLKAEAQGPGVASATTLMPYFATRYATPPVIANVSNLTSTDFQNLLLNERRREFYGEGHWWYDIKRTGRKDLLTTLIGRNHLLLYPIPQTEKDLAGYIQNAGY